MSEAKTDRELLGLAAKAAGHQNVKTIKVAGQWMAQTADGVLLNYLHDDGDAQRLAVGLGLAVIPYPIYVRPKHSVIVKRYEDSQAVYRGEVKQVEVIEVYGDDPAAATRRAITRAAAAIGGAMK